MDKREWKILESVKLGLDHYYMEEWKPIKITDYERAWALSILPTLPKGWEKEDQDWFKFKGEKKKNESSGWN